MSNRPRPERFYGVVRPGSATERSWPPVQNERPGRYTRIHPRIHDLAAAEYNRQGFDQSAEVLARRGGLFVWEVIALLADALLHERGESISAAAPAGPEGETP